MIPGERMQRRLDHAGNVGGGLHWPWHSRGGFHHDDDDDDDDDDDAHDDNHDDYDGKDDDDNTKEKLCRGQRC